MAGPLIHKFMAVMTDQASQYSRLEGGGAYKPLSLANELWTVDDF